MRWLNTVPSLRVQTLTTCTRKPAVVYANHIEREVSKRKGLTVHASVLKGKKAPRHRSHSSSAYLQGWEVDEAQLVFSHSHRGFSPVGSCATQFSNRF
jgi:hypothetical protein